MDLELKKHGRTVTVFSVAPSTTASTCFPYDKMQLNGGGIHFSRCPLIRDSGH
ncbi:MAG: hypothetical protein IH899_00550 [Planctomycetes bacterium]|nr:hypothetical protein [Planctomycetota bacterium]